MKSKLVVVLNINRVGPSYQTIYRRIESEGRCMIDEDGDVWMEEEDVRESRLD